MFVYNYEISMVTKNVSFNNFVICKGNWKCHVRMSLTVQRTVFEFVRYVLFVNCIPTQ